MPRRRAPKRKRYRTKLHFDTNEALLEHRELEFLRAAATRPRKGHGRSRSRYINRRAKKLDQVQKLIKNKQNGNNTSISERSPEQNNITKPNK